MFYGVPIAIAVLTGFAAAAVVLRRTTQRPRPAADFRHVDDQLRYRSGQVVVAACGLLVAVPLAGTALQAGDTLVGLDCGPLPLTLLGWPVVVTGIGALVAAGVFAAVLLTPRRVHARVAERLES